MTRTRWALGLLLLAGCDAGTGTLDQVDPDAIPAQPTWSAPVEQVFDLYCNGCHSEAAQTGALEGYAYDTCATAKRGRGETLEVMRGGTMPPPTGLLMPAAARLTLERWFAQGAPCD